MLRLGMHQGPTRGDQMPINESHLSHLIRRTEIVSTDAKINELRNLPDIEAAVDAIIERNLANNTDFPSGGPFFFDTPTNNNGWLKHREMRRWWVDTLASGRAPLREKMTLFWHGHFTSSAGASTSHHHHAMSQQKLYRDNAFGNFRTLAQGMAIEPLMIRYLNNDQNRKGQVNENFGRELLELFILGLDPRELLGNQDSTYTQNDVLSCAKAWTGHNMDGSVQPTSVYRFYNARHVDETITFLGKTGSWDGPDTINHVLDTNPYREISCLFIAEKLWSFFAYPTSDVILLRELIKDYKNSLEIVDLLKAVLKHPQFYSERSKKGLVSTPAEFVARVLAFTGVGMTEEGNDQAIRLMPEMGQELLNPPNVSGWRPNSYWLSTSSLGARGNFARTVFDNNNSKFRILEQDRPEVAVTKAARQLGIVELQPSTAKAISDWVAKERVRNGSNVDFRSAGLFHMIVMSPDFQLS